MSFQALARTWRPRRFDELVGQAHVVRALTHALEQDKLHHALLFSGTRGVGKTTLARIIAKCLNCEHGVSANPCRGEQACGTCREIDEGRFIDLIEVDAASRTGVDDTRELMDNVQYAPTRGRTKVYLIDEVHMLSKHSFNALLKTLEEPPPRVQFLLATTEPEKIPVTILSRCLQFPLKRLPLVEIAAQLAHIVDAESLSAEEGALTEIARAADGSMRDGLSLLDQAVAFGGGTLDTGAVREMLGTIGDARVAELVETIVTADAGGALAALAALYAQGIDMRYLLDALATAWQHIATIQVVGEAIEEAAEPWVETAARVDAATVQLFYDITLAGIRDLAYAPDPLVGVKMSVLRMLAFVPAGHDEDVGDADTVSNGGTTRAHTARAGAAQARAQLQAATTPRRESTLARAARPQSTRERAEGTAASSAQIGSDEAGRTSERTSEAGSVRLPGSEPVESRSPDNGHDPRTADRNLEPERTAADSAMDDDAGEDHPEAWHTLVPRLQLSGFAAQLANNGVCRHMDNRRIVLELARTNEFLATPNAREGLQAALERRWAPANPPRLVVQYVDQAEDTPAMRVREDADARQRDAEASIENDPFVRQLRDRLGAEVRAETIKPNRQSNATQQREEQ